MALIFISHSSRDADAATRLRAWLADRGFDNTFLDIDKHAGIQPGDDWERRLYREIERSHAMVLVVTANWMESKWCFAEFTHARALGKQIFPIIETPVGEQLIAGDIQNIDLRSDRSGGLEQLARALSSAALQSAEGFVLAPGAEPYPGLSSFEEKHAAVFFGRDDVIVRLTEVLRRRQVRGGARLVAVLGASGSGKSSLLRAGLLPRLKLDRSAWIVLQPIRPGPDPERSLLDALLLEVEDDGRAVELERELGGGAPGPALAALARLLRRRAKALEARIIVPIDQLEEVFTTEDDAARDRFFTLLSALLAEDGPWLGVATLRSDYLGDLQSATALKAPFEAFPLEPMPTERIGMLVRGPARVASIHVDESMVNALVHDAQSPDALPLVAFTLWQLYDRYGRDGRISLRDYEDLGDRTAGVSPLAHSIRLAAEECLPSSSRTSEDDAVLREAFVPHLVRVNKEGRFVRQAAALGQLPERALPFIEKLIDARLLVRRSAADGAGAVIEVAHEALFRVWPALAEWLEEERDFLIGKERLQAALSDWQSLPESERDRGLLQGVLLDRAQAWLDAGKGLLPAEQAFIRRSAAREEERLREQLRRVQSERDRALFEASEGLALGIAREIEQNYDILTDEKVFLARRLASSMDVLQGDVSEASALPAASADLHATLAYMLFEVGRFDEAARYAGRARELLDTVPDTTLVEAGVVAGRVELALGLTELYEWRFDAAAAHLERARSLVPDAADDSAVALHARIRCAEAERLRLVTLYGESIRVTRDAIDFVRSAIAARAGRLAGDLTLRALDHALLRLNQVWHGCVEALGWRSVYPEVHAGFAAALDETGARAAKGWQSEWEAAEAQRYELLAAIQRGEESRDRARESLGLAVEKLHRTLQQDPQNLRLRYRLAGALSDRVSLASDSGDRRQASADLDAIREIAISLRRDSANDMFGFSRLSSVDYLEAETATDDARDAALERLLARTEAHRRRHGPQVQLERRALVARASRIRRLIEAGEHPAARDEAERAVAALESLAGRADVQDLAGIGCHLLHPVIQSPAEKIGRSEWLRNFERAEAFLRDLEPDSAVARSWGAVLAFCRGDQLSLDGRHADAIVAFDEAAAVSLADDRPGPTGVANYLTAVGRGVELRQKEERWDEIAARCIEAAELLETLTSSDPPLVPSAGVLDYLMKQVRRAVDSRVSGDPDAAVELSRAKDRLAQAVASLPRQESAAVAAGDPLRTVDLRELEIGDHKAGERDGHMLVHRRLGWASRSIYPGPWRTLVGDGFEEAARAVAEAWGVPSGSIERIRVCTLSFYGDGRLLEAEYSDADRGTVVVALLRAAGADYRLNGTSPPIHECNARTPITLRSADETAAYLRFFGSYVTGDSGSFQPVEEIEDLPWLATARTETKLEVGRLLRPLAVWPDPTRDGWWRATATIRYGDAIFHAAFTIQPSGMMEMNDDVPMATSLLLNPPRFEKGRRQTGRIDLVDLAVLQARWTQQTGEAEALLKIAEGQAADRPAHFRDLVAEALVVIMTELRTGAGSDKDRFALIDRAAALLTRERLFDDLLELRRAVVDLYRTRRDALEEDAIARARFDQELADALDRLAQACRIAGDPDAAVQHAQESAALRAASAAATGEPRRPTPAESSADVAGVEPSGPAPGSRFERCDFLLGKDLSILIVVPAALPSDAELTVYVTRDRIGFTAGDRFLADLPFQGGEAYDRLAATTQVGLVEFVPGTPAVPERVTHVASVVVGRIPLHMRPRVPDAS